MPGHLPCHYVNRLVGQRGIDDLLGLDEHEPLADLDRHLLAPALPAGHQFDDLFELIVQWDGAGRA